MAPTFLEGDVIAPISGMLQHYAKIESGMEIHFGDFKGQNIPPLNIDRSLIERVFINLIVNAIKYGKNGDRIEVMPWLKSDGLYVAVVDHGMGVDSNDVQRVFIGTFRSPKAKAKKMGLGLGLKIAKAAMEKHGGKIELNSPRDPTVFSVFFPRKLFC